MGFSRQEYWSGFPGSPPGYHPDPGVEPSSLTSLALPRRFFTTLPPGNLQTCSYLGKESLPVMMKVVRQDVVLAYRRAREVVYQR